MQNTYQNGTKEGAPTERFFEWAGTLAFGKPQRQPLCSSGSNAVVRVTDNLQTESAKRCSMWPNDTIYATQANDTIYAKKVGETLG